MRTIADFLVECKQEYASFYESLFVWFGCKESDLKPAVVQTGNLFERQAGCFDERLAGADHCDLSLWISPLQLLTELAVVALRVFSKVETFAVGRVADDQTLSLLYLLLGKSTLLNLDLIGKAVSLAILFCCGNSLGAFIAPTYDQGHFFYGSFSITAKESP